MRAIPIELPRATERRLRSKKASGSPFAGFAIGVAQPEMRATAVSVSATPRLQRIPDDCEPSARGVGQPDGAATFSRVTVAFDPSGLRPVAEVPRGTV